MAVISDRIEMGNALSSLMTHADITPGDSAGYELCKQIYLYHPHGSKIVDRPIALALSKPRNLSVPGAVDDGKELITAFEKQWLADECNEHVANVGRLARIYGPATLGVVEKDADPTKPLEMANLSKTTMSYNEWDPLNTSGSLVFNQDPNSLTFQKNSGVRVNGQEYHHSRVIVLQHENPIYIAYESSGYGFTGRSAFQRALLPLKQFVQLMQANGMVALKAGVIVAKVDQASSMVDKPMLGFLGLKRNIVKDAQTGNVISIGTSEEITAIDLTNVSQSLETVRRNIIEDEAAGAGVPAKLLLEDTFAVGFGEGTEDSKSIAQFLQGVREWLQPVFAFLDRTTMRRAWNEEFFAVMQDKYPNEYGALDYETAFIEWENKFEATWPNLLEETDEEKAASEKVTLEAVISAFEALEPILPPSEKAKLVEWVMNNLNAKTHLFAAELELDVLAISQYAEEQQEKEEQAKRDALEAARDASAGGDDDGDAQVPKPPKPKALAAV